MEPRTPLDDLLASLPEHDVNPEAAARVDRLARAAMDPARSRLEDAYTRFVELKLAAVAALLYLGWAFETLTALHR